MLHYLNVMIKNIVSQYSGCETNVSLSKQSSSSFMMKYRDTCIYSVRLQFHDISLRHVSNYCAPQMLNTYSRRSSYIPTYDLKCLVCINHGFWWKSTALIGSRVLSAVPEKDTIMLDDAKKSLHSFRPGCPRKGPINLDFRFKIHKIGALDSANLECLLK